jgi:hypothetical protein
MVLKLTFFLHSASLSPSRTPILALSLSLSPIPFKPLCTYELPDAQPVSLLLPPWWGLLLPKCQHSVQHLVQIPSWPFTKQQGEPLEWARNEQWSAEQWKWQRTIARDQPNFDFIGLCGEGEVEEVVEHMGWGVGADYSVFYALLDSCGNSGPLGINVLTISYHCVFRDDFVDYDIHN